MSKKVPKGFRCDIVDQYFNYMLKQARVDKGYSLADLADISGVTLSTISSYERLRGYPDKPWVAMKICEALEMPVKWIFPEWLREYTCEVRRERESNGRCDNPGDALFYAVSLEENQWNPYSLPDEFVKPTISRHDILRERFNKVFRTLTSREREAIKLRFGFNDAIPLTINEIASKFGVERQTARDTYKRALLKLQYPSRANQLVDLI